MGLFTMLSTLLCLLFFFLCLKTAFSSSLHASSFSTTQLCSHEEAFALLQFKTSFSINYTASDLDDCNHYYYTKPYSKTESWKEGIECCSWDGVSCDNVTGHVIALDLSCSFLYGTFPSNSTLFLLKNLQSLNLALNDFRLSKIPPKISRFTRLEHLDISYSQFSGRFPAEIAHLPKLVSLNLSTNLSPDSLYALILETTTFRNLVQNLSEARELWLNGVSMASVNPRSFLNLSSSLTTLELSNNKLRGNFPISIFRFPNLKIFKLSGLHLTIDLPSSNWSSPLQELTINIDCTTRLPQSIGDLKSLQSLILSCNLGGSIPASIGNLSQLTYLDLNYNNLSGQIPSSLANLTQLSYLDLSKNSIHGNIPKWICEKDDLGILDLSHNNLGGKIPNCLPKFLSVLNLQGNNFDGNIPFRFPEGCGLQYLNLHGNQMGGLLPRSLVNCSKLEVLDVSNNNIEDTFPHWLKSLRELQVLVLRSNKFSGLVQTTKESPSFPKLRVLDLSNNDFLGPLPVRYMENFRAMMDPHRDDSFPEYMMARNSSYQYPLVVSIKRYMYELQGILTIFTSIDLSHNKFGGEIPDVIGKLSYLVGLNLSHNNLMGPIPPSLGNLMMLEWLDLSSNGLVGKIPNELASLTMLSVLNLSHNQLTSLIPPLMSLLWLDLSSNLRINADANFTFPELFDFFLSSCNLSEFPNFLRHSNYLGNLVLSNNSLHGNIPEWICKKDGPRILDLSHNNLGGKIPNCLPKFLSVLNLQGNNFDGNIPFRFTKGCGLQNLNLHGNQMDGPLPRSLVNCSMLEVLDVGNNKIEDTFPHWLKSLPELQVLVLRSNKFHSFVQSTKESPSFPKLRVLDLSNNDFHGPLPVRYIENFKAMMDTHTDDNYPEYMKTTDSSYQFSLVVTMKGFEYELQGILTTLTSIDLSKNKFGGEIPDVIGKLSSLKGLNLSHNNLGGPISRSLGNLTNLEWLDLSSNELVGEIPNELVSLTQLEVLNLSNNHLVGRIPQGNQFNTFENYSYEGNLGLCGLPLSKSCDEIGTQPSSFQEKDEFWRFGWRVVVLGYGCGVVFGLLMGYHIFRTGKPKWFVSLFDGRPSQSGRKIRKARRLVRRRN